MTKDAFNTVKALALVFCVVFAIVISNLIWTEWQDSKPSLSERQSAYNFGVAIPADGYLALINRDGTLIIIVDPKRCDFIGDKALISTRF